MAQIPNPGASSRQLSIPDHRIEDLAISVSDSETGKFYFTKDHKSIPACVVVNLQTAAAAHVNLYLKGITNVGNWATGSIAINGATTTSDLNGDSFTLIDKNTKSQLFTFNNTDNVLTGGSIGLQSATDASSIISRVKTSVNNISNLETTAGTITQGSATPASATLKFTAASSSRYLKTGDGAIISLGTDVAGGGFFIQTADTTLINDDYVHITFGALSGKAATDLKDVNGLSLASRSIQIYFTKNADVSGLIPGADVIFISCVKQSGQGYDSRADFASVIAAVINGESDNAIALNTAGTPRTWGQAVKYGANASGICDPQAGGDKNSVFIAERINTSGVKVGLRGSQGTGADTQVENHGAWGGEWANDPAKIKLVATHPPGASNVCKTDGDQTMTNGNNTGASTITLTADGTPGELKANESFMVGGNKIGTTADDSTLTNIAGATLTGFSAAASLASDLVTFTSVTNVGPDSNSDTVAQVSPSGTWTLQGVADGALANFTGGDYTQHLRVVQNITGSAGNTAIDMSGVSGGTSSNFIDGTNYGSGSFRASESFTGSLRLRAASLRNQYLM